MDLVRARCNVREQNYVGTLSQTHVFKSPIEFEKLPEHRSWDIDIELEEGTSPPFGPMYKLTPQEKEAVAEYVHTNLKRDHIRPSKSSAGASVLFTRKKTGEIRLCVDFRGLNRITKKNRFPLPLVDDLLTASKAATTSPSSISKVRIVICAFGKETSGKLHSALISVFLNILSFLMV
ncbi:hypothetical protein MPER_02115 [Moniliophthora perniciosa FA553]|nr:hypothetical protein MPER_02115 [Moniliophthora perniciosa FA553]